MPDWLDVANGWLAVPLQLVGFGIAYWQIFKTRSVAVAARDAAKRTEEQIGGNLLLLILPQLVQIETNLEWSVSRIDRHAAMHYLGSWRWQAGQLSGHLARQDDSQEMLALIQASIAMAADTKLALQDEKSDVARRCKSAQKTIAAVTGKLGELTAKNSIEGTASNAKQRQAPTPSAEPERKN
ncbi:hypothetical protein ASF74_03425 [Arthrobacter sp. Leaf145]|nr:hypothetical protein ASF74_03425 [Arthrobacter sp. Leaf145]